MTVSTKTLDHCLKKMQLATEAYEARARSHAALLDFQTKWSDRDISLPDLVQAWAERNRQVEINRETLKEVRKELKAALKAFGADPVTSRLQAENAACKELVELFKRSFDQVMQTSRFAEQSFQSVFLVLAGVSDPATLADCLALLLRVSQSQAEAETQKALATAQAGDDKAQQDQELRSMRAALHTAQAAAEAAEQAKLELVYRFEEQLSRREEHALQASAQHPAGEAAANTNAQQTLESTRLLLQLEQKRGEEVQRKLSASTAEVLSLDGKLSAALAEAAAERSRLLERVRLAEDKAQQCDAQLRQQERSLAQLEGAHARLLATSSIDWFQFTADVLGCTPEGDGVESLQSQGTGGVGGGTQTAAAAAAAAGKFLRSHYRRLESECVAYRVRELEQQHLQPPQTTATATSTAASTRGAMAPTGSQSDLITNGNGSGSGSGSGSGEGDSQMLLQAITRQRNALQEEVTRLRWQQLQGPSGGGTSSTGVSSRRTYDVESGGGVGSGGARYAFDKDRAGDREGLSMLGDDDQNDNDTDNKLRKAFDRMNTCEQLLVSGSRMGLHDYWSRHALMAYVALLHIFALFYVVHDLNPQLVSEVDRAMQMQGGR